MKVISINNEKHKERLRNRLLKKGFIVAEVSSKEELKRKERFLSKAHVVFIKGD